MPARLTLVYFIRFGLKSQLQKRKILHWNTFGEWQHSLSVGLLQSRRYRRGGYGISGGRCKILVGEIVMYQPMKVLSVTKQ